MLNARMVPFFEEQDSPLLRILTDRGTEYCGRREHHHYQLYLAVKNVDHSRTRVKSPQTNGICERFHRIMQDEFYSVAFRTTWDTARTIRRGEAAVIMRNGASTKTLKGNFGEAVIEVPRDRNGTFEPKILGQARMPVQVHL